MSNRWETMDEDKLRDALIIMLENMNLTQLREVSRLVTHHYGTDE